MAVLIPFLVNVAAGRPEKSTNSPTLKPGLGCDQKIGECDQETMRVSKETFLYPKAKSASIVNEAEFSLVI